MSQPGGPDRVPSGVGDSIAGDFQWCRITFVTSILYFSEIQRTSLLFFGPVAVTYRTDVFLLYKFKINVFVTDCF